MGDQKIKEEIIYDNLDKDLFNGHVQAKNFLKNILKMI